MSTLQIDPQISRRNAIISEVLDLKRKIPISTKLSTRKPNSLESDPTQRFQELHIDLHNPYPCEAVSAPYFSPKTVNPQVN